MIVVTFDTTVTTRAIYYDGVLGTIDPTYGGFPNKINEFSIGESVFFTGRFFAGSISNVVLWNYALTAAQVQALYSARL